MKPFNSYNLKGGILKMGLIRAFTGAVSSTLQDQWKEFIYCDSLSQDVLMAKGRPSGRNGGSDNIISNGSKIIVNEGQCMIIVEDGKVVDFTAEPGGYEWDKSSEPSLFTGGFGEGIKNTFKTIGARFTYGGQTGRDQRVYFINTLEIRGAKFGTRQPIPFALVDHKYNLEQEIEITCFGSYSYRITDPLLFYKNIAGNVTDRYRRDELEPGAKSELLDQLQKAFAVASAKEIKYSQLGGQGDLIREVLAEELKPYWKETRGIEVQRFNLDSVQISEESKAILKTFNDMRQNAAYAQQPNLLMANAVLGQTEAMKTAAGNSGGAMTGLMGMGMIGGMGQQSLGAMGMAQLQQNQAAAPQPTPQPQPESGWTCNCGQSNQGKFCCNCGTPQPAPATGWTCSCGQNNQGKFCSNCGTPQPVASTSWTCKCGSQNEGKFCPQCGSAQQ